MIELFNNMQQASSRKLNTSNNMINIPSKDRQSTKYRRKYKYLKKVIKSLIIENAALCDEVAKIQESIVIVKDERKFLLRKLLEYENETESSASQNMRSLPSSAHNGNVKVKKRRSPDTSVKNLPTTQ